MTHPNLNVAATLATFLPLFVHLDCAKRVYAVFDMDTARPIDTTSDQQFNQYWLLSAVDSLFYSAERIENEKDGELIGRLNNGKFFYFRVDMLPSAPMYIAVSSELSQVKKLFCDFEPLRSEMFHMETN